MKRNVVLWDGWEQGNAVQWMAENCKLECLSLTVLSTASNSLAEAEAFIARQEWDYLLIFEQGRHPYFRAACERLHLPPRFVVYALDGNSWQEHPAAFHELLHEAAQPLLRSQFKAAQRRLGRDYATCTVNGLSYVATSADNYILPRMISQQKNDAQDDMEAFYELAHRYFSPKESGYFLDLGANIGTSGIYFTQRLAPGMKLLAFEPEADNYRMLQCNLLLNRLDKSKAIAVNLGLGAADGEETIYLCPGNPGGNGMYPFWQATQSERIRIIPLDRYLAEQRIAPEDVQYIWMDTEGFEAQVIVGAANLLQRHPVPIFTEFNATLWQASGYYEKMMAILERCYTHFIRIHEYRANRESPRLYPVSSLWAFQNSSALVSQLGDIFFLSGNAT